MLYLGALVAFGLGALLAVSELAYTLLKWCGAGYLCWLGIQLLLRPRQQFNNNPASATATSNWFLRGMLGNVLNPKMGVFYVSFYLSLSRRGIPHHMDLSPVTIHVLIGTLWSLTLITATRYAAGILKNGGSEMDGSNDRLPVSAFCGEAGDEPPVIKQGPLPLFCALLSYLEIQALRSRLGHTLCRIKHRFPVLLHINDGPAMRFCLR